MQDRYVIIEAPQDELLGGDRGPGAGPAGLGLELPRIEVDVSPLPTPPTSPGSPPPWRWPP